MSELVSIFWKRNKLTTLHMMRLPPMDYSKTYYTSKGQRSSIIYMKRRDFRYVWLYLCIDHGFKLQQQPLEVPNNKYEQFRGHSSIKSSILGVLGTLALKINLVKKCG